MVKLLIYIVLVLCVLNACRSEVESSTNIECKTLDISKISCCNLIDSSLKNVKLIPLHTDSTCLMGFIDKIEIDLPYIFILDFNHNLFIFKNNGVFVKKITAVGRGVNEISRLKEFYLNPYQKYIGVFDDLKQQIFKFSYTGKLLEIVSCKNPIFDAALEIKAIDKDKLLLSLGYFPGIKASFAIVDSKKYKTISNHMAYPYEWLTLSSSVNFPKQFHNIRGHFAINMFSDTLYRYVDKDFIPWLVFNLGAPSFKGINPKIVTDYSDIVSYVHSHKLSHGISKVILSDTIGYIECFYNKNLNHVFWNLNTYRAMYFPNLKGYSNILKDFNICSSVGNYFVGFFFPYQVDMETIQENYPIEICKILESLKEDDNPVLVFYPICI